MSAPDTCPECGGQGLVWGCCEDTCSCGDDQIGCAPSPCDLCRDRIIEEVSSGHRSVRQAARDLFMSMDDVQTLAFGSVIL